MPKFPDLLLNNNPNAPSVDLNDLQVKGVGIFADAAARDLLNSNLHTEGYLAIMKDTDTPFIYTGGTWTDAANWSEVKGSWEEVAGAGSEIDLIYESGNVGVRDLAEWNSSTGTVQNQLGAGFPGADTQFHVHGRVGISRTKSGNDVYDEALRICNDRHSSQTGLGIGPKGYGAEIRAYSTLNFTDENGDGLVNVGGAVNGITSNDGGVQIGRGGISIPGNHVGHLTSNYRLRMAGPIVFKNHSSVSWFAIHQGAGTYSSAGVVIGTPKSGDVLYVRNSDHTVDGVFGYVGVNANNPSATGPAFEVSDSYGKFNDGLHIGDITSTGYSFPTATGTLDQVLKVDANGDLVFGADNAGLWAVDTNGINYTGGNVGIGVVSSSNAALKVQGDAEILTGSGAQSSVHIGSGFGGSNTNQSVYIGYNVASGTGQANSNVVIGANAGGGTGSYFESVIIGNGALAANTANSRTAVFVGYSAGAAGLNGFNATGIGFRALFSATGTNNVGIGQKSGMMAGGNSTFVGNNSGGLSASATGAHNVGIGTNALSYVEGNNNTALGSSAGRNNVTGSSNIFIGYQAGENETGSNKLYISNSNTTTPLIYGEFDNDLLRVNGSLYVEQEHVYKQRHKTVATGHVGNQTTDSTNNTIHVETYYTRSFEGDGIATSEYTGTGSRRIYYSNKFNADPTKIDSNDNPDGWEVVDFLDVGVDSSNDPQQFNTFVNTFAASKASLTEQIQSYEHIEGQFSIAVAVIPTKLSITTTGANEVFKFNVQPEANGTATSRCPYALCTVNWGDGTSDTVYAHRVYGASNSYFINQSTAISIEGTLLTAVTFDDAVWNHTYATAGNYTVTITGGVQGLSFYQNTQITSINFGNQVRFGTYTFKDSSIQTFKGRLFYTQAKDRTGDRSPNSILEGCSSLAANQNIDNWFSPTNKEYANEFLTRYWSSTGAPANLETLTAGKNIKVTNPQIANWRPTNGLCPGINFDWTEVTAVFARSMELTRFPMAEGLEPKAENVISLNQSFSGSTYDMGDEMVRLSKNRPYVTSIWRAFQSTAWSHYGTWRTGKGFTGGETHGSGGGASNYTTPGVFIPWFIVPGGYGTAEQTTSETTNGRSFIKGNFDTDLTHMGLVIGRYNNLSNAFSDNAYYSGKGIENWDVSNVTNMQNLFLRASSCTPDISRWDVSSVTTMANIFWGATRFNSDISDWDVSSLVDAESMFLMAVSFNQDISRWDTSSVIDAKKMFCLADNGYWQGQTGAYRMKFDQNVGTKTASRKGTSSDAVYAAWDMSSVTTMNSMFAGFGTYKADFNNGGSDSIQYWDTSSVVTDGFKLMFYNAHKFNQPLTSQTVSDIEGLGSYTSWDVSNATDFESMFQGCDVFNQDLSTWRPTSATNFKDMFENAISFNGDVSDWVVASTPITSFNGMFRGATSFTGTGLNTWVLPTGNDFVMNLMFLNNTSLTGDITSWVTTRCTNMESMFQSSSFDQDISGWDTSNVTTMKQMFYDADSFNQDIGGWDISSIPDGAQGTNDNMYSMFAGGGSGGITGMSQANISSILVAWEAKVAAGNGPINMRIGRIPHSTNLTAAGQTAKTTLENTHGWLFS